MVGSGVTVSLEEAMPRGECGMPHLYEVATPGESVACLFVRVRGPPLVVRYPTHPSNQPFSR